MFCCTSCTARATSVPYVNSAWIIEKPLLEVEVVFDSPSTPVMADSIGSVTSRSTISGEAPG